jgi:ABC-2 type transport system ATP-binding protein
MLALALEGAFAQQQNLLADFSRKGSSMTEANVAKDSLIVDRLSARLGDFQLHEISFKLEPGQVTALLGHNGAGKTTTLRLIMGIVRKDSGLVSLCSFDHQLDEKEFKRRIGFVQEESFFYSGMTIAELVAFVSSFYCDWNEDLSQRLLQMLDLPRDKKLGQLSKGMRTKVGLVVALSHQPSVLLLDEPTSGLDPRAKAEALRLLQRVAHDDATAVLFSTHNLHEVDQIADRVIIVDRGRVLANEGLSSLRSQNAKSWNLEQYYLELVS